MKKFTFILFLNVFVLGLMAQPFLGVSWVSWDNEPDYDGVTGYADNPYDKSVYTAIKAPTDWVYDGITDAATFDATWNILGDSMAVANPTNVAGGDIFDLGAESPTFGSAWKAVHDGTNLYVLLKYWDFSGQADADSRSWEIMTQPTSIDRHEPTLTAAQDSAEGVRIAYENQAYARFIELGGGKALFKDGTVGEFAASIGLAEPSVKGGSDPAYYVGGWGANDFGLTSLALVTHFWDMDADGTIRAIMVMPFDGALAYPADPADLEGDFIDAQPGDTISFEVKSNATTATPDDKVEYFWNSDKNNGYASNYYSGYLVLEGEGGTGDAAPLLGVSWVGWDNEPDYTDVTGYADNPYENPELTIKKAPDTWSYAGIADDASFDATWNILGDSMAVANPTNVAGGDIFDLGADNPTFGSAWKGVHDGENLYILLKYWDLSGQANADSRSWEIMTQPTSIGRHEPTFTAAQDSAEGVRVAYENQAYARFIELGGGKAVFKDGTVGEFAASIGLAEPSVKGGSDPAYYVGGWGANDFGVTSLALVTHFWDMDADGTIRAIMVMPFDGALAYPADPTDLEGDYISLVEGQTIALEVKSNATTGADDKVEYFWASDKNNGYASNYYVGHVTISSEQLGTSVRKNLLNNVNVYTYNNFLRIKGMQNVDVRIYSVNGTLVKSVQNVTGQFSISELPKGLYIVKLNDIPAGFKVIKE